MNEEPQRAERSPTYEVIQRAPMVFEEHLENIGVLQGQIFEELDAPGEWFLNEQSSTLNFYRPRVPIWTEPLQSFKPQGC